MKKTAFLILVLSVFSQAAYSDVRIKDVAALKGARLNQLFGYGLVVGLNKTGDSGVFTQRMAANLLRRFEQTVGDTDLNSKNIAAVMVTTNIPPFVKTDSKIDVMISSIGNASSLEGGTLLFTPLKGIDGNVYAVAQGSISVGGLASTGASAAASHPTVGYIRSGATIEKEIANTIMCDNKIQYVLHDPDFTTAFRMAHAINKNFFDAAKALDASSVVISIPREFEKDEAFIEFISLIEGICLEPDTSAKVVINEKTGTIAIGQEVTITPFSVTLPNGLSLNMPAPSADSGKPANIKVASLMDGLKASKISDDTTLVIKLFQELKKVGALQAELIIE